MQRSRFLYKGGRAANDNDDDSDLPELSTRFELSDSEDSDSDDDKPPRSQFRYNKISLFNQGKKSNSDSSSDSSTSSNSGSEVSNGKVQQSTRLRYRYNNASRSNPGKESNSDSSSVNSSCSKSGSEETISRRRGLSRGPLKARRRVAGKQRQRQNHLPFLVNPNPNILAFDNDSDSSIDSSSDDSSVSSAKSSTSDADDTSDSSSTSSSAESSSSSDADDASDSSSTSSSHQTYPTEAEMLAFGMSKVGFGVKRQQRAGQKLNLARFKAHYGVGPKTVRAIYIDLKKKFPDVELVYYLLTLNWFNLYDVEHTLAGRWGYCEDHIRKKLKENAEKIQSLKEDKIVFDGWGDDEVHIVSVDGVNFITQEFRCDPSSVWYDHKSRTAGLTYEFALAIRRQKLVHIKGPEPAGKKHDITIFRGGKKEQGKDNWEKDSLYFKLPEGKKAVGDSGYNGEPEKVTTSQEEHSSDLRQFLARAKNRQESFHTRLKSFNILGHRFRHGKKGTQHKMQLHKMCVEAVCVIVQYDMENGHPLFEV